jgi:predicted small secreted protein
MEMKKSIFVLGIISIALIMGFFLTGCATAPQDKELVYEKN